MLESKDYSQSSTYDSGTYLKSFLTYCGRKANNLLINEKRENVVATDTFMLNFYFNIEKFISTFDKG